MRVLPLISAVLVTGAAYMLVMEREALDRFAGIGAAGSDAQAAQLAAANGNGSRDTASNGGLPEDARQVSVVVRESRARPVDDAVLLRGRTEAARAVDARAETSGRVISDPARRGSMVEAGEILCRLDPGPRGAALAEAEARLAEADLNARNVERLSQGGHASETMVISARAARQSAEAGVEAARREIERLEIVAPFGGLLEDDAAELGSLLQPGGLCATVIQLDPMRLVGFVPEADVDRVTVGTAAGGRLAGGREVAGQVTFLSRAADPQTRTFRVEVTVPNPDLSIRDGQTVEMLISTPGTSAHLLPGSALTLDDGGTLGVRLADEDDRARFAPVQVLRDTPAGIWLTGLPEAARVIVVGQEYVAEGVPLAVTMEDSGQ
ncbi:MAG: efflux RND transporter periplasmic adaptor subunit [Gemmobacter sp.]